MNRCRWLLGLLLTGVFVAILATQTVQSEPAAPRIKFRPSAPLCEAQWTWQPALGRGHIHTLYSTPEAFGKGSNRPGDMDHAFSAQPIDIVLLAAQVGFGFILFSDHGEGMTPGAWLIEEEVIARAAKLGLVVLRGFEWTQAGASDTNCLHVNVVNTHRFAGIHASVADWQGQLAPNFAALQQWLETVSDDWCMTLNHPWLGQHAFGSPHSAIIKRRTPAIEVIGGSMSRHHSDLVAGEQYLCWALGHGWEVGPASGDDNFGMPFGPDPVALDESMVMWQQPGAKLTPQALVAAMLARRISVRLEPWDFRFAGSCQAGQVPLGGHLKIKAEEAIDLAVRLAGTTPAVLGSVRITLKGVDQTGAIIDRIDIPLNQMSVKQTGIGGGQVVYAVTARLVPNPRATSYFAVVSHDNRPVVLTAPIFLDRTLGPTPPVDPLPLPIDRSGRWQNVPFAPAQKLGIGPNMQIAVRLTRNARWPQAVRLSEGGKRPIVLVLDHDLQSIEFPYTRLGTAAADLWIEPFFCHPTQGWCRTTLVRFSTRGKICRLECEDGGDEDYNDLIVEVFAR